MLLDRNTTTLICTSTGGPPTNVVWKKNGTELITDGVIYQQSQRVIFTENATYENVLSSDHVSNFIGNFTCEVKNIRGSDNRSHRLSMSGKV